MDSITNLNRDIGERCRIAVYQYQYRTVPYCTVPWCYTIEDMEGGLGQKTGYRCKTTVLQERSVVLRKTARIVRLPRHSNQRKASRKCEVSARIALKVSLSEHRTVILILNP